MIGLALAALALGLAGVAHCIGMCGGVAGMLCGGTAKRASVKFITLYNAGRVLTYAILGAIAGAIGASASAFPFGDARTALRVVAAILAVLVGLELLGLHIGTRLGSPFASWLRPIAAKLLPIRSAWQALALGMVWGWLPCGMVYGASVLAVSAETVAGGMLVMASFGLGTLPAMLATSTLATRMNSGIWLRRSSGAVLILSGLWWSYGILCARTQILHDANAQSPSICAGHALGPQFARGDTP